MFRPPENRCSSNDLFVVYYFVVHVFAFIFGNNFFAGRLFAGGCLPSGSLLLAMRGGMCTVLVASRVAKEERLDGTYYGKP
jgi:hypothetical protein